MTRPRRRSTRWGRRLRERGQHATVERAERLQRELDEALAAATGDRERADTAEAHLTAFTPALAVGNVRAGPPGDPA